MTASKWYRNLHIYLGILLTTISILGCVKADKTSKRNDDLGKMTLGRGQVVPNELMEKSLATYNNAAQFQGGDIQLTSYEAVFDGKSYWKQANKLELQFKLCGLQEVLSGGPLQGQKFTIKSELGAPLDAISEVAQNCLHWTYHMPVDLVAPSVNIALHFEIKSLNNLGKTVRRFGFNPWDYIRKQTIKTSYKDLTNHSRKAWGSGYWVYGTDRVLSALRGDLLDNGAKLKMTNLSVHPVEKSPAGLRYEEMLKTLSPREREIRKRVDAEMRAEQGVFIKLNLSANPVVSLKDATGVNYNMPIDSGRFKVFMNLLAHNTATGKKHIINQYVRSMSEYGKSSFTWSADQVYGIQASLPMVLKGRSTYGDIELVVKIIPVDLKGVKPFTAVYNLGQYNAWAGRQTPPFQRESYKDLSEVEFANYLQSADNYDAYIAKFEKVLKDKNGKTVYGKDGKPKKVLDLGAGNDKSFNQFDRFYFDKFNIRFMRIMPGETSTDRTFQYSVESCISDGITGAAVGEGLQFEVTTWDKKKPFTVLRQTRNNGCLVWFGFVSHKYYHKEVLEEKKARVRFVSTVRSDDSNQRQKQYEGLVNKITKNFIYYMNPWDEKFTFGWDGESLPENYAKLIEKQKKNAPESKLFIPDFRYETMGFRYEIDKYMDLKVKKTVLLKMHPVVLKYNSIVYGRRGTEPLRDGLYLMKVALQKDYLDPAARGIVIRDRKGSDRISQPIATKGKDGPLLTDELIDADATLRQDKKQQITIQEKIVRVLGGIIITPIEFAVKDLRLMRIRNQFFVQLQTIDENKLRLATYLDGQIDEIQKQTDLEAKYDEIFTELNKHQKSLDLDQIFLRKLIVMQLDMEAAEEILNAPYSTAEDFKNKAYEALGLNPKAEDFKKKLGKMRKRLEEIFDYSRAGVSGQTAARNDKWRVINRILFAYKKNMSKLLENGPQYKPDDEYSEERPDQLDKDGNSVEDPFTKYFMITQDTGEEAIKKILGNNKGLLEEFQNTDFTTAKMTPSFSFDFITNDGMSEEQSGLPSRTFVGPLTFLLNTNGSPLRPTDILEETVCLTATCVTADYIKGRRIPVPTAKLYDMGEDGSVSDIERPPILALGDSVNASYENNAYYGYLEKYGRGGSGKNGGWTVDDLIVMRDKLLKEEEKNQKTKSQIINFVGALGLKYVNLSGDESSDLLDVEVDCVKTANWQNVDNCFKKTPFSESKTLHRNDLFALLNGRAYRYPYWKPLEGERSWAENFALRDKKRRVGMGPFSQYFTGQDVSTTELTQLMKYGWKDSRLDKRRTREIYHRFCYALSQQLLSDKYLKKKDKYWSQKNNWSMVRGVEKKCHDQVENLYKESKYEFSPEFAPPIIFERKVRVFDTTNKYVYRGGKSLNVNTSASFSLSHARGFGRNRSAGWKPSDWVEDTVGGVPVIGKLLKNIVGAFSLNASYGDNDNVATSNGTTVTSATFLVGQQATFDIALGQHERCMVARFSPLFIRHFLKNKEMQKDGFNEKEDFETLGFMICSGEKRNECLPIKEKYYYFTQHFTEGDMLDTSDLHNHPWLLQLRGYRDFQAFVSLIGARKQKYADASMIDKYYNKIKSDAAALREIETGNKGMEFEVVSQEKEPDWPLASLGEAYFHVLPTFPGLYTYVEDDEHQVRDWPYGNPDPAKNKAFGCTTEEYAP